MIPSQARLNIRCIARIFSDTIPEAGRLFLIRHAVELSGSQWLWLTLQRGHTSRTLVYFQLVIDFLHAASAIAIPPLYEIVGASDNLQPACDLANQDLYRSEKAVYCCQLFEVQCSKQYRMHEKPNTHRSNVSANTSRQTGRSNRFHSSFFRKLIAAESLKC